ncbi:uncharacterized protein LOC128922889 [Zeugodacus cucurbitae]|uniref:uncharacterized protein LOC128922889 n=1 Tax=Zeugodacus cucurbitae TaxID=28588 RepID=UPI0023D8F239|nr:uncharacterized protein LOC128922889 [Zeugodacus cucurbitae]
MTKIECNVTDKMLLRLKAVKRDVTEATVRAQLLRKFYNCNLHIELLRKYNYYQLFFINKTNHTCPYDGEFIVDRFRPLHTNLMLPLPTGDYLIKFLFYNSNAMAFQLFVWFGFKELEKLENRTKVECFQKSLH